MMTKAVEYINAGKTSTQILPVASEVPSNPSGSAKAGNLIQRIIWIWQKSKYIYYK